MSILKTVTLCIVTLVCFIETVIADEQFIKVAVFNFSTSDVSSYTITGSLDSSIRRELQTYGELDILSRRAMDSTLSRLGDRDFSDTPEINQGIQLGVDIVISGNIEKDNNVNLLEFKLFDIRHLREVSSEVVLLRTNAEIDSAVELVLSKFHNLILDPPSVPAGSIELLEFDVKKQLDSIKLTWSVSNESDILHYRVFRGNSINGPFKFLRQSPRASLRDIRASNKHYFYKISAVSKSGNEYKFERVAEYTPEASSSTTVVSNSLFKPTFISVSAGVNSVYAKFLPSVLNPKDGVYRLWGKRDKTNDEWKVVAEFKVKGKDDEEQSVVVDGNFVPGARYQLKMTAAKQNEESEFSASKTVSIPPPVTVTVPTNSLARRIELAWNTIGEADGYSIYRRDSGTNTWSKLVSTKSNTVNSYVDKSDLTDGSSYDYYVVSFDRRGEAEFLTYSTAQTKPLPRPPRDVDIEAIDKDIMLRWDPSETNDLSSYLISRRWESGDWEKLSDHKSAVLEYLDANAKPYRNVQYKIEALDVDGLKSEAVVSNWLASPVAINLSTNNEQLLRKVQLSWNQVNHVSKLNLYRKEINGSKQFSLIKELKGSESRFEDSAGLADGKEYEYKIHGVDSIGEMPQSNIVLVKTKPRPDSVIGFVATSDLYRKVELRWQPLDDSDVAGYRIYRSEAGGKLNKYEDVKGWSSDSFTDKGSFFNALKDNATYAYQIVAFNKFDGEGKRSVLIEATTKDIPEPPTQLKALVNSDQVALSWVSSIADDIDDIEIFRGVTCSDLSKLATVLADSQAYNDDTIKPGTNYCYSIRAVDVDGLESDYSDGVMIQTSTTATGQ